MIANRMRITTDAFLGEIFSCTASATHTLRAMIRDLRRSRWFPLLAIAGGAVLAVIAVKLLALFATAFDISFLRDVGGNAGPGAAAGAVGAGAAAGAAAARVNQAVTNPPSPPPWWKQPAGPPAPDGSPPHRIRPGSDDSTSAGPMVWFSQGIQNLAFDIMGNEGRTGQGYGSSGSAGKA